jgi:hypothetical protein
LHLQGLKEFRLLAICDAHSNLSAMLVLGHLDASQFQHDPVGWQQLADMLTLILPHTLKESHLPRFVTFAEMVSKVKTRADMVLLLARWVPYVMFGAILTLQRGCSTPSQGTIVSAPPLVCAF